VTVPAVFSDFDWLELAESEPKSASRSTAAGFTVAGGDRGEGNVIGWTVDAAGRPVEETPACVDVGR